MNRIPPSSMLRWRVLALASSVALAACAQSTDAPARTASPAVAALATVPPSTLQVATGERRAEAALPRMIVTKSPSCGCCTSWVEHMRHAGFAVDVREIDNLNPTKERVGVPFGKGSCHTAEVDGYFIEGHVPAEDVKRLLAQRPKAKGLVVPGMPAGSPGMELPDGRIQPYAVELVALDGSTSVFARHGQ